VLASLLLPLFLAACLSWTYCKVSPLSKIYLGGSPTPTADAAARLMDDLEARPLKSFGEDSLFACGPHCALWLRQALVCQLKKPPPGCAGSGSSFSPGAGAGLASCWWLVAGGWWHVVPLPAGCWWVVGPGGCGWWVRGWVLPHAIQHHSDSDSGRSAMRKRKTCENVTAYRRLPHAARRTADCRLPQAVPANK
jgi:hypothetical protein